MNTARVRFLPKLLGSFLFVTVASFSACTPEVRDYSDGGGGSTSSSSSSGAMVQCSTDAECGANDECQLFSCLEGFCKVTFATMGTPVANQAIGDCQSNVCDGNGYVINVVDLADPQDDGNPCTLDACVDTQTQHGFLGAGTACNTDTWICDGFGVCVECLSNDQCASGVCAATHECAAPGCTDNVLNGLESDIDCGGPDCPLCPPGAKCQNDTDCKSHVCRMAGSNKTCDAPTCSDAVKNGSETGVDCGGPDCPKCGTGGACGAGLDCMSGVCLVGVCQEPTCSDQTLNGNETDTDCGGNMCAKCSNGRACYIPKDCLSNNCCLPDPSFPGYCAPSGSICDLVLRSEITK